MPPDVVEKRRENGWAVNRALSVPELFNFYSREPRMFPDELRDALKKYDDEAYPEGECLIWPGILAKTGAIELYAMRKRYSVPRLLYCRLHDVGPADLSPRVSVKQSCGNPYCVNPEHQVATVGRRRRGPLDNEAKQVRELEQETEADLIPQEVLAQARVLRTTGWGSDLGSIASTLGVARDALERALKGGR